MPFSHIELEILNILALRSTKLWLSFRVMPGRGVPTQCGHLQSPSCHRANAQSPSAFKEVILVHVSSDAWTAINREKMR